MGMQSVYKHTLYININNRVVNHYIEPSSDGIKPGDEDSYVAKYNKTAEMFVVYYYSYDGGKYSVEKEVVSSFRQRCYTITNGITTQVV